MNSDRLKTTAEAFRGEAEAAILGKLKEAIEKVDNLNAQLLKSDNAFDIFGFKTDKQFLKLTIVGLAVASCVGFGSGYALRWGADSLNLSKARDLVQAAKNEAEAEKESFKKYQAEVDKKSEAEVEKIRAAAGWAASPDGRLAKRFFDLGGKSAATCSDEHNWRVEERTTEDNKVFKVCITKMRNLVSDDKISGWRIP